MARGGTPAVPRRRIDRSAFTGQQPRTHAKLAHRPEFGRREHSRCEREHSRCGRRSRSHPIGAASGQQRCRAPCLAQAAQPGATAKPSLEPPRWLLDGWHVAKRYGGLKTEFKTGFLTRISYRIYAVRYMTMPPSARLTTSSTPFLKSTTEETTIFGGRERGSSRRHRGVGLPLGCPYVPRSTNQVAR